MLSDLIGAIEARQREIMLTLASGGASSFESYCRLVGHYQGLQEALDRINHLMEEDEEDVDR